MMFNRLYDLCGIVGIDVGIRVYEHGTRTTPAVMGILITHGKKKICEYKMGAPDDPTIEELSEYVINELEERGFLDAAASS